ncbi:MAG: DoxX family protein [Pyrinomonadaceae bacterium]|nr:DoxX family protein [Pyrinomonadaceae bacterium]
MNTYLLHPLARFLVALIFIMSGMGKLFGFTQTAAMMESVGFPAPSLFLVGAILLEIVGGVLLLVGYKARWASLALFVFLIPATLIFHAANLADPAQGQQQMIEVLKNLAILGALVKFAADGAGAYALDNVLAPRTERVGTAETSKVVREEKHA